MLLLKDPSVWLKNLFVQAGLSYSLSSFLSTLSLILFIALLSWIANVIAKLIIRTVVLSIIRKSGSHWDDIFYEQKVFMRLSHFAPAIVIYITSGWALHSSLFWLSLVHYLNYIYMLAIGMVVILSFIDVWNEIYETLPIAKDRSIKGYVQLLKILVVVMSLLIIISIVFKREISKIITGLGAMAAVLILVFRDTLLGLVGSIRFLDDQLREKLSAIPVLKEYIKTAESIKNDAVQDNSQPFFNVNRLTNLGLFRYYAEQYLRSHPLIDKKNIIMLRHRAPAGNGLPVQVYAYTSDNSWVPYEHIQSEIFEHLLAIIVEFDLRIYQQLMGDDIMDMSEKRNKR